ncbi:PIH1 domain-containing protein 2 isoform X2 [Anabas testudineus]|uniref:PIH1 domain-containing protein 2 isoform X2 n=1 Tax=Anabas testudineus TaxID=64144 RepID=UPI000E462AF0|nr:PIH1 domain-containing protein 2 isoform X2 [Anabas testudineus]
MSFAGSTEDVLQQVSQFWSMLDDLCETDPEAYSTFIQRQMKEGAELTSPPQLDSCLRTEIQEPKKGLLYVNICSWKRVPAPQDPSKPLPLCAGKLETDTKKDQGLYTVLDVAINPVVLQESKKDKKEISHVYMLALSFVQQQHGMKLSQEYTVVSSSPKSSPDDLHRRLGFQPNIFKQSDTASQSPATLLQQISCLRSEKQDKEPEAQMMCRPAEHKKKDLIQVISSTFVQPQKPEYQLEVKTDTAGIPLSMELTVELPKVCSMSECQLSISKDVLLAAEDFYYLLLEFPKTVNEDTASAVFNKKKRRLTLRVDVL